MKKLAIFSVLAALACSPVNATEKPVETVKYAYNADLMNTMVIHSSSRANKQASQQQMQSLDKAMEKLNAKLNSQLEERISKAMDTNFN